MAFQCACCQCRKILEDHKLTGCVLPAVGEEHRGCFLGRVRQPTLIKAAYGTGNHRTNGKLATDA